MFDKRCRVGVERELAPLGQRLQRLGVSADLLTGIGLFISLVAAGAIGAGWLGVGAFLLALSAVPDLLDGAVAKAAGTASARGAFFDSVVDRVSDSVVLGGFAWYLAGVDGGRAALLPMALLAASWLVSYERARAESLGFSARGGLMERAERMLALGASLIFSGFMVPILWGALALTSLTSFQRFGMVWRQASAVGTSPSKPPVTSLGRSRLAAGQARGIRGWRPQQGFGPMGDRRDGRRIRTRERRNLGPAGGGWRRHRPSS
ncbi:MAG: CDP-alcohol phosphatidyltransferase family protein [Acidimicrobiales bacterium]